MDQPGPEKGWQLNEYAVAMADVKDDQLMTPGEVARLFRVDPKTVTRWAKSGKLPAIRTLGGHRRFRVADIRAAQNL
jgi:excisionase family DNA binding protein